MDFNSIYYYNVFGLILKSEKSFNELVPSNNTKHDFTLCLKSAKHPFNQFKKAKDDGLKVKQNENNYCLILGQMAEFMLTHEQGIVNINLEIKDEDKMPVIKTWLFGSVFKK